MKTAALMFAGMLLIVPGVAHAGPEEASLSRETSSPVVQVSTTLADAAAQTATRGSSSTPITWRGDVGLFFIGGDTGFLLGGGGGARPFDNQKIEIAGDLHFARINGYNGLYASGNGLYHFTTSNSDISPFAGGGLGILHSSGDTQARLQIMGGLDFNQKSAHPLRADLRFLFTDGDTTTILMLGVGLGR